jgi:hypothetical protein
MHCFPRVYSRGPGESCARLVETREGGKKDWRVSVLALHSHIKCKVNQRLFVFQGAALAACLRLQIFSFLFSTHAPLPPEGFTTPSLRHVKLNTPPWLQNSRTKLFGMHVSDFITGMRPQQFTYRMQSGGLIN